jgi:hypothetical protein
MSLLGLQAAEGPHLTDPVIQADRRRKFIVTHRLQPLNDPIRSDMAIADAEEAYAKGTIELPEMEQLVDAALHGYG